MHAGRHVNGAEDKTRGKRNIQIAFYHKSVSSIRTSRARAALDDKKE
jgi:hypothetical protein